METLYLAADPIEAEILREYLAAHGISCSVLGSGLWSGRGELGADVYPKLVLQDERDRTQAEALLRQYEHRRHSHAEWHCACGEASPMTFETCWSCGEPRTT
ncbi:DUF2007 domain-containing protein [Solimonas sp. SE-A11]|uniref:putative signal transducing protein n=1 Tax=Solimonas sp. SE-A11 TaxID=3054954 RepID=UPI00259CD466|nr:DUF2007 domain-containing protein [Solimonas sp. SE-A11]MDM4768619.1 DUF2007 domain-containing protein [Solimonas sp. SE-A11]